MYSNSKETFWLLEIAKYHWFNELYTVKSKKHQGAFCWDYSILKLRNSHFEEQMKYINISINLNSSFNFFLFSL